MQRKLADLLSRSSRMKLQESFLSPYVFETLVANSQNVIKNYNDVTSKFVSSGLELRLTEINRLLFTNVRLDTLVLKSVNEDWLKKSMKDIWIIIFSCYKALKNCSTLQSKNILLENCEWTGKANDLKHCLHYYLDRDHYTLYTLLYTTAVFEDAITNLYFMFGNKDVVLIRDMLHSEPVLKILGTDLVSFIELIIGNSKTLNIRNIVWHGFANEAELPACLPAVMFLIMNYIGNLLRSHNITKVPKRSYCHVDINFDALNDHLAVFNISGRMFCYLIRRIRFFPVSFYSSLDQCCTFYSEKMYGSSTLLLLPQLEHLLRCVFVEINGLPLHKKMAQHDEFYVTLDEVLPKHLVNGEMNKLYEILGDTVMIMIHDAFVYPTGPRIKDCVSHGTLSLINFPEPLFRYVFNLTICIMTRLIQFTDESGTIICDLKKSKSNKQLIVSAYDDTKSEDDINDVYRMTNRYIDDYQSLYHPSALLKSEEIVCATNLQKLNDAICRIISDCFSTDEKQNLNDEMDNLNELKTFIKGKLQIDRDNILPALLTGIRGINMNSIESVRYDSKFLLIGRRIIQAINKSYNNLKVSIEVQYEQWKSKTMRSRRRRLFCKMLHLLPILASCLECILFIVYLGLSDVYFRTIDNPQSEKLLKILKKIQGNIDNIVSYTDIANNNWENVRSYVNSLNATAVQYFNLIKIYEITQ